MVVHIQNIILCDFLKLQIHNIFTPWMVTWLCPEHVCIVGNLWGTQDLGFTDTSRNGPVGAIWPWNWNVQYWLSSYSNMTSGLLD